MADYTQVRQEIDSMSQAAQILPYLQDIYRRAQLAQSAINLYVAASDPVFNATVDEIFSAGERAELNTMLGNLNTLVTAWTNNHATLLAESTE